ncbi:MAG: serine/threonine protein kinase, partial [Planctomycetes bacterium]|nr:serine/threonine protein kinase [Planctomycetota bacterium]
DIKPDNLMLDQHGAIKIADLGLASAVSETRDERAIGTPHFMAPEQVLKQDLDHRTDLYALGCTFYRLVTGTTPFRGQTVKDILRAQVKDEPEPASKANPDVPQEVDAIIQRLMRKDPADRYQTANELLEELEAMLQPPQKRGLWIGLAATAVLVAGGAIYWAVTKPKEKEVVTIKEKYDDPLTQQFADRIKVLEAEAKQKDAKIALLEVRASGARDEQLATALEGVAIAHAGTAAATQATRLAGEVRQELARRQQLREQRRAAIAEFVAKVRSATVQPLDAYQFELAVRALDVRPPQELQGEQELIDGVAKLRDEIYAKARARLEELRQAVVAARQGDDEQALATAIAALEAGLQPESRWPQQVAETLAAARQEVTAGQQALTAMQAARRQNIWQTYHELIRQPDGLRAAIARFDFAAAAEALAGFASNPEHGDAAARATALQGCAEQADLFARILEQRCGDDSLRMAIGDETVKVVRWDRDQQQLVV